MATSVGYIALMAEVKIADLRDHVSQYVRRAARGETVVILNRSRPVAALGPYTPRRSTRRLLGLLKGTATIQGDIVGPTIPPEHWFRS
jgi:prevent-host-death family protein